MQKIIYLIIFLTFFLGYSQKEKSSILIPNTKKNLKLTDQETLNWHHKDIIDDTIPGISLDKAYKKILNKKKLDNVIIAIIDQQVEINHEDLKDQIWNNPKEIPDNNIDDDNNGYIDDIHGWNFLGNSKGENIIRANYEFVRVIRKFDSTFKNKRKEHISSKQKANFLIYKQAQKSYEKKLKFAKKEQEYADFLVRNYPKSKKLLKTFFPQENYTLQQVDSLYKVHKENSELGKLIYFMYDYLKYNLSKDWIIETKKTADERLSKLMNFKYNDRSILGDDPNNLADNEYGNNIVNKYSKILYHGTNVTGVIASTRDNNIGAQGILNNCKIMVLSVSPIGDENDKDISLAIKYAVDNGAKIINMSFGKDFSINKKWVNEAIKYASEKDVLIVSSAGNESRNLDNQNIYHVNDTEYSTGNEISNNFLLIGSSTYSLDKNLKKSSSNYGKSNVDLFAPGHNIYTTSPLEEKYKFTTGSSYSSAIVSGIAALIRSCYPDLKAFQIKEILMKSGISYNIDVEMTLKDNTKKMIPFSDLSKSGKIVNAYNALLMAEQVSKGTE
ncbi:S8 family serine peptidase [Aquimarina longa]|uniref:S8 family serine peptidase n=1 Tax=Aquimarina longa TaxID=1080221 RepID=UPI0007820D15|nr:S8 family serine peptidase [Aquimarina longa]